MSPPAASQADPFQWTVQAPRLDPGASGEVRLTLHVPEGTVVYRDQLEVQVQQAHGLKAGEADFPPGLSKPDPANPQEREEEFNVRLSLSH